MPPLIAVLRLDRAPVASFWQNKITQQATSAKPMMADQGKVMVEMSIYTAVLLDLKPIARSKCN